MARPCCPTEYVRRTYVVSPELHRPGSNLHRQVWRSLAALHAGLDRTRAQAAQLRLRSRSQDRAGHGSQDRFYAPVARQVQRDQLSEHAHSGRRRDGRVTRNQRGESLSPALGRSESMGHWRVVVPANRFGESDAYCAGHYLLGGGRTDRKVSEESWEAGMRRREFLIIPASALGGTLLYTLAREPFRLEAQEVTQEGTIKVPLRFFTAGEARVIAAACERIFPSDASGPGAKEAGVVIYIDRQLAGPYGADKYRYTKGPFADSVPEHGYQGKDNPRETYHKGIENLGVNFDELPVDQQIQ